MNVVAGRPGARFSFSPRIRSWLSNSTSLMPGALSFLTVKVIGPAAAVAWSTEQSLSVRVMATWAAPFLTGAPVAAPPEVAAELIAPEPPPVEPPEPQAANAVHRAAPTTAAVVERGNGDMGLLLGDGDRVPSGVRQGVLIGTPTGDCEGTTASARRDRQAAASSAVAARRRTPGTTQRQNRRSAWADV